MNVPISRCRRFPLPASVALRSSMLISLSPISQMSPGAGILLYLPLLIPASSLTDSPGLNSCANAAPRRKVPFEGTCESQET